MRQPVWFFAAGSVLVWIGVLGCDSSSSSGGNTAGSGNLVWGSGGTFASASGGSSSRGGAGFTGVGGTTGTGNNVAVTSCRKACDTSYAKGCAANADMSITDCYGFCDAAVTDASGCDSEIEAYFVCYGNQPLSSWVCDADGIATLQTGLCETQSIALETCTI